MAKLEKPRTKFLIIIPSLFCEQKGRVRLEIMLLRVKSGSDKS